ncbi:MAG: hypothetical protein KUG83_01070 [Gammaproteobacteria bacterium]|nr:hypothetical protein [Gammaproteobacteria bacterium]
MTGLASPAPAKRQVLWCPITISAAVMTTAAGHPTTSCFLHASAGMISELAGLDKAP